MVDDKDVALSVCETGIVVDGAKIDNGCFFKESLEDFAGSTRA